MAPKKRGKPSPSSSLSHSLPPPNGISTESLALPEAKKPRLSSAAAGPVKHEESNADDILESQTVDDVTATPSAMQESQLSLHLARISSLEARLRESKTRLEYVCGRRNTYYTQVLRLNEIVTGLEAKLETQTKQREIESEANTKQVQDFERREEQMKLEMQRYAHRAQEASRALQEVVALLQSGLQ
ncbi:hypothetical protein C8R42DRAFT_713980 [Lentinula raphanica]|nr:hypothetical protein C8R42DRAFT_713980 [Lentinula raphanica]